ncbi:MAG: PaaI family thioesterase [Pseudomonadota bacterium]
MAERKPFFGLSIPFLELLGAHAEHWERGRTVVSLDIRPELTNSWETAHGGVVMTLLDVTLGSAARSIAEGVAGVVTVDLSASFLRAGNGRLRAEGRVLRGGRSLVFCEGEVRDSSGELVAKGMGTFKLKRRREAAGPTERQEQ